ncbi:MAG: hypothetical protein K2M78_04765 [Lachnospiraceae bacterium]|nr:hypothetical protein [Lachnospiraceae bacterium]
MNIDELLEMINQTENKSILAAELSWFISDALKTNSINIYEAYLLNGEVLANRRKSYLQPAWNEKVQISTCLGILNQRLMALVFRKTLYAEQLKEWGLEAFKICGEKRPHYIMDRYREFIDINVSSDNDVELLRELIHIRERYDFCSYDEGPYHTEVFPYEDFEPENLLINHISIDENEVRDEIQNVLIELGCL